MGAMLSEPVLSTVVEKKTGRGFRVGLAEMNGWRKSMEDAHIIHICKDWGFFGVFDGHGGDQCSAFVAKEFSERLERDGCPKDDAAVKELVFAIDQSFLDTGMPSGSTAAMCIVHRPTALGGKIKLRVVNAGDSRVLLGKRDGSIVDGGGTDMGLSTDHKPNHPVERERIYRCGGTVKTDGPCPRVNGDLAVSRGFGDAGFKKTGGPGPEDRPVTADPELGEFECDEDDMLIIVCDGVSEGEFSNAEVVKLISESLKSDGDTGTAARLTILEAEKQKSKDNITCMVVLFDGAKGDEECKIEKIFTPGPIGGMCDAKVRDAYDAMAKRAELTLEQACEKRYEDIEAELSNDSLSDDMRQQLEREQDVVRMQDGATPIGEKGSQERAQWFEAWMEELRSRPAQGQDGAMSALERLIALRAQAPKPDRRWVKAPDLEALKLAVDSHSVLDWQEALSEVADREGVVESEDAENGTTKVSFRGGIGEENIVCSLPSSCLQQVEAPATASLLDLLAPEAPKRVRTPGPEALRRAVDEHPDLQWDDVMVKFADSDGVVLREDNPSNTTRVKFGLLSVWLPTHVLEVVAAASEKGKKPVAAADGYEPQSPPVA